MFLIFTMICNVSFILYGKKILWNTVKMRKILTFVFMSQKTV